MNKVPAARTFRNGHQRPSLPWLPVLTALTLVFMVMSTAHAAPGSQSSGDIRLVKPVTAEGIAFALDSGIMAAEVGADALERGDLFRDSLQAYDRMWMDKFGEQFRKSVVFTHGFPPEAYAQYVNNAIEKNGAIQSATHDLGRQYELMVKLKAIVKSL